MEPTALERALFFVAPKAGEKAYRARTRREQELTAPEGPKMQASGYGNHGASRTLNSMVGWLVGGGSAREDIDEHSGLLRKRARDLYTGGGLARGGMNALRTNVVGIGVQPKPKIDGELLHMSDEACAVWERNTLREFKLFAENNMCDAERQKNFYALQKLAFLSMLMSGDVFAVFGMKENKRTPYQTTIRLLEADRICTPGAWGGETEVQELPGGGMIVDGVEIDREGTVVRYHIANRHPLSESVSTQLQWTAIEAIGKDTGYPNILHITTFERPEQRRGIPFIASQIEQLKQQDRYINSELAANVVASMLALFLESEDDNGKAGMEDAVNEDEKVTDDELKLELAPGAVYDLPPGKKMNFVNPVRNNTAFESFTGTLQTIIGSGMEIPKEVLIKKYDSNYTAARSALLDFWKTVKMYRADFIANFKRYLIPIHSLGVLFIFEPVYIAIAGWHIILRYVIWSVTFVASETAAGFILDKVFGFYPWDYYALSKYRVAKRGYSLWTLMPFWGLYGLILELLVRILLGVSPYIAQYI